MNKVLIIGYGNVLRGDDGIGWTLADLLAARLPHADVITMHQLTPELAEPVSEATFVVFLDACAYGEPGAVRYETVFPENGSTSSFHHLAPETLLTITRHLYSHCPPALLFSISGVSFEFSDTLSPLVHHMLPSLVDAIYRQIETHITPDEAVWEIEPCLNSQ